MFGLFTFSVLAAFARTEKDLLGAREVPGAAYYGVQTARALENFQISDIKMNTYPDLTSGPIDGGMFGKLTALVNWYVTPALWLEAAYGYGRLDRMDRTGGMDFFQTRVQLQFK